MTREMARDRLESLVVFGGTLRAALADLFSQEFAYSSGHLATILNTCLFAPSLLTFWFVNGLVDFSTAVAIGAVATPAGLQVRLLAYLLLVPTFLLILPAITSLNISTPRGVENLHVIIAGSIRCCVSRPGRCAVSPRTLDCPRRRVRTTVVTATDDELGRTVANTIK
jgi:hypothetical protein